MSTRPRLFPQIQEGVRYTVRMDHEIKFLRHELVEGGMIPRPLDCVFEIPGGQIRRVRIAGHDREELSETGMPLIPESEFIEPAREWLRMQLRKGKSVLVFVLPDYVLPYWKTRGSIPPNVE